jgi:hypothetical protein
VVSDTVYLLLKRSPSTLIDISPEALNISHFFSPARLDWDETKAEVQEKIVKEKSNAVRAYREEKFI